MKWRELVFEVVLGLVLGIGVFMALIAVIWAIGI
jgi:hypothetical protein